MERAFGILVRRWGCLWRPIEARFDRAAHVALCCLRLHNLCLGNRDHDFTLADLDKGKAFNNRPHFDDNGVPRGLLTDDSHRPQVDRPKGKQQRKIVNLLRRLRLERPPGS